MNFNRRDFLKTSFLGGGSALVPTSGAAAAPSDPAAAQAIPLLPAPVPYAAALPDLKPAHWVWFPSTRCLANSFVLFRRQLKLPSKPVRARGWIAAESRYRLEVNGRRIQWGPAPSDPRWSEADPLDLAEALQAGDNAIGATVLYYGHGDGTWPMGKPGFLFWLELEFAGGERLKLVSDHQWNALLCRAWRPGQYKRWFLRALQEEFDARLYPHGWTEPSFQTAAEWLPAQELAGNPNQTALNTNYNDYATGVRTGPPYCELRARSVPMLNESIVPVARLSESLRIRWLRNPEEYFECHPPHSFEPVRESCAAPIGEGAWVISLHPELASSVVFELAEQVVGWPRFTIEAPAGTIVELLTQEGHTIGGPALLDTQRDSWTRFICREGVNRFETFDFESLRWIQLHVRGSQGKAVIRDVGMRRRVFPWAHPPVFKTSDSALQRLWEASVNTLHNCAQDTLVDGMGRERQQYSGDCGHQLSAVRLAFGDGRPPARFLSTYSQGMTTEGYFLDCWPAYDRLARMMERQLGLFHLGPIIDHGVQLNFDCWLHYLDTGDLEAIREPFPRLVRFANYLRGIVGADGLLPVENLGIPCVWLDYEAYNQHGGMSAPYTQRHKQCAFNLYTAAMLRHAFAPMARTFQNPGAAAAAERMSDGLLAAAVRTFWSPDRGMFVNNLPWLQEEGKVNLCDRSLANSIIFDQCPGGNIAAAVRALAERPPEMGISYPCNAIWRQRGLVKGGRADALAADLRKHWASMPSVALNNTVQEQWTVHPDTGSQWSHCALGPLIMAYQGFAGIRSLAPGYSRVEIWPQLADLEELQVGVETPQGRIRFHARGQPGSRTLDLQLPAGCAGELLVNDKLSPAFDRISGPAPAGYARYRVPSGGIQNISI